jgi:hypothetical protein
MEETPTKMISEDWKKEYEKILLTRKYAIACNYIGIASATPTLENVKNAYGSVIDYLTAMPLPEQFDKTKDKRKGLNARLDEIGLLLFGVENDTVKALEIKYEVVRRKAKEGGRFITSLDNLPNLIKSLRNILIEAGEYATSCGLRVTLAEERVYGEKRLLEEEEFEDWGID